MYTVFWVGGELDGKTIATFDTEREAIKFAKGFFENHENEFHAVWGGVAIVDPNDKLVEW